MRTLYLFRHAKSSWARPAVEDHDRPLNTRGQRAAGMMAAHLADKAAPPDLILCSSAERARQTLHYVLPAFNAPKVAIERGLYLASAKALLRRLHHVPDDVGVLMLIGHNPGLHELAVALTDGASRDLKARVAAKFPTAALATYRFDRPWEALAPERAMLVDYVTPRDVGGEPDEND